MCICIQQLETFLVLRNDLVMTNLYIYICIHIYTYVCIYAYIQQPSLCNIVKNNGLVMCNNVKQDALVIICMYT